MRAAWVTQTRDRASTSAAAPGAQQPRGAFKKDCFSAHAFLFKVCKIAGPCPSVFFHIFRILIDRCRGAATYAVCKVGDWCGIAATWQAVLVSGEPWPLRPVPGSLRITTQNRSRSGAHEPCRASSTSSSKPHLRRSRRQYAAPCMPSLPIGEGRVQGRVPQPHASCTPRGECGPVPNRRDR